MKRIGIIPNTSKDGWEDYTREVSAWTRARGITPVLTSETAADIRAAGVQIALGDGIFSETDLLVVLGGDGTMLSVAGKCALNNLPLLGINLGTLGYLTDVDKKDGLNALEKVLRGEYLLEKRMMLETKISGGDKKYEPLVALNDVCVTNGVFAKMISLKLYINEEYISTIRADGLILSTPTGSTAYNLSAGGPILKPDAEMVAIAPICPHSLHSRPWVIPACDTLDIYVDDTSRNACILSLDGQDGIYVQNGSSMRVSKSEFYTTIVKTSRRNFYDVLRTKMMY